MLAWCVDQLTIGREADAAVGALRDGGDDAARVFEVVCACRVCDGVEGDGLVFCRGHDVGHDIDNWRDGNGYRASYDRGCAVVAGHR